MMRNKLFSIINIVGLSLAVGACVVSFIYIDVNYNRDQFHKNGEHIFLAENVIQRTGQPKQVWGDSPIPLGPALKADFPQVERMVRIKYGGGKVGYGDKLFSESLWYVDPDFFHLFTFPLRLGEKNALKDRDAVVLSDEMATKYFGSENPIGKQIKITFRDTLVQSFFVKGVAEPISQRASFRFRFLLNFENLQTLQVDETDWNSWTAATFIQVHDPKEVGAIASAMTPYSERQNAVNTDWPIQSFLFDNLYDLARNSDKVRGDISNGSPPEAIITLFVISIFLMLLACFNYVNIAIASAGRRLKEIGIRKVVGSSRIQLIGQFLGEHLMLCFFALLLGLALAEFLFLPGFNYSVNSYNPVSIDYGENIMLWLFFIVLLILTGIGGGAYPALFISGFQPVSIFRGKQKLGGTNIMSRVLLTLQFVLAFILISAGIIFSQNAKYQRNLDWGYDQEQTVVVRVHGQENFERYHNAIRDYSEIVSSAASRNHIGKSNNTAVIEYRGKQHEMQRLDVSPEYLTTMGIRLQSGRIFEKDRASDLESIVINETFVREMKWEEPIGQQVEYDSVRYTVIGTVEDFHMQSFFDKIEPTFFRVSAKDKYFFLSVRAKSGKAMATQDYLKSTWEAMIPDIPFDAFFQDSVFDQAFRSSQGISNVFVAIAWIALILSCMGLFGLVSLSIAKRRREFSIRKVLGASMVHVAQLVNREFIILLSIAIVIATPISYFMVSNLIGSIFKYHIGITAIPFIVAGLVIILTSLSTVSSQLFKVARTNPVEALRQE